MSQVDRIKEAFYLKKKAANFVVDLIMEGNDEGVEYDQWKDIFHSCQILISEYQGGKP